MDDNNNHISFLKNDGNFDLYYGESRDQRCKRVTKENFEKILVCAIFLSIFYHTLESSKPKVFAKCNREMTEFRQSTGVSDLIDGVVEIVRLMLLTP